VRLADIGLKLTFHQTATTFSVKVKAAIDKFANFARSILAFSPLKKTAHGTQYLPAIPNGGNLFVFKL